MEDSETTERPTSELEKILAPGDTFTFLGIKFTVMRFENELYELYNFGIMIENGNGTEMHVVYNGNGKLCRTYFTDRDLPVMLKTMKT